MGESETWEERYCANCGNAESVSKTWYNLDNEECVCSEACFLKYSILYFDLVVEKGELKLETC